MRLSKVLLVKDGRQMVIQGMCHIAPQAFYKAVQDDIDRLSSQKYTILYEKVIGSRIAEFKSERALKIRKVFLLLLFFCSNVLNNYINRRTTYPCYVGKIIKKRKRTYLSQSRCCFLCNQSNISCLLSEVNITCSFRYLR